MKSVSAGFQSRLALEVQSFCFLVKITRVDGTVIRLADCDEDVTYAAATWTGAPGFNLSAVTSASFGQPSSCDIDVPLQTSGSLTGGAIDAGYFDEAEVRIDMIDFLSVGDGVMNVFLGRVNQAEKTDTGLAALRCVGFSADLLELIVERVGPDCRAPYLGHARCGFNVASLTRAATVASVTNARTFSITVTEPLAVDGWFANGAVQFTSGANNGLTFDVRAWTDTGNVVGLWFAPHGEIQVGDTLDIAPGCDFTRATCHTKFDNVINFQGFIFTPTERQLDCGDDDVEDDRPPVGDSYEVEC